MVKRKIQLGDQVTCKLTGFKGFANARAEYLFGCIQIEVQSKVDDKGNWSKGQWIDETQLEIVKKRKEKPKKKETERQYGGVERNHP